MTTTRLCIVRHGETDWNAERRIQGHIDIELNRNGHAQADATARGIVDQQFAALYCSDLLRAVQTATALAPVVGLPLRKERALRERHYGRMQGKTYEEILAAGAADAERFRQRVLDDDFGDGESLPAFADRIYTAVDRLATAHPGHALLLVTHGGVLDVIYRRAVGRDLSSPRDFAVPNAALNWLEVSRKGWRILSWADTRYLDISLEQSAE